MRFFSPEASPCPGAEPSPCPRCGLDDEEDEEEEEEEEGLANNDDEDDDSNRGELLSEPLSLCVCAFAEGPKPLSSAKASKSLWDEGGGRAGAGARARPMSRCGAAEARARAGAGARAKGGGGGRVSSGRAPWKVRVKPPRGWPVGEGPLPPPLMASRMRPLMVWGRGREIGRVRVGEGGEGCYV